ncbi:MAG: hypothetical protein AB8B84_16505, partial [Granulosicoccus sp.]
SSALAAPATLIDKTVAASSDLIKVLRILNPPVCYIFFSDGESLLDLQTHARYNGIYCGRIFFRDFSIHVWQ